MIKRTVFIGFKYPHHGAHSGYDQIADYLPYDLVLHAGKLPFFRFFQEKCSMRKAIMLGRYTLLNPLTCFYRFFRIFCFLRCAFMRHTAFHFAYPETGLCFSRTLFTKKNRFIATVHLPGSSLKYLSLRIQRKLNRMDHLITMSDDLMGFFENISCTSIPHGVDVEYFRPGPKPARDIDILMLGNWLRDFSLASRVFRQLLESRPGTEVYVVALRENLERMDPLPSVYYLSGISDEALLDILQRSKCLFLPLKGLTANNAILEAAACGCQIALAIPKNESISYFNGHIKRISSDILEAAEQLNMILEGDADREAIVDYTKVRYGWPAIAERSLAILKDQSE